MGMLNNRKVVVVDRNPAVARAVARRLREAGYQVSGSERTLAAALAAASGMAADALLIGLAGTESSGDDAGALIGEVGSRPAGYAGPVLFYRSLPGPHPQDPAAEGMEPREISIGAHEEHILLANLASALSPAGARPGSAPPGEPDAPGRERLPDSPADGVLAVDAQGRVTGWNRRFLELWGVPEAVIAPQQGEALLEWVRGQLRNPAEFMDRVRQLRAADTGEHRDLLDLLDGRVLARCCLPQVSDGRIVGAVLSFREVSGPRQSAAPLRESEERFRVLFEMAPDAYFMHDLRGILVDGNRAAEALCGYRRDELIGRNMLAAGLLEPRDVPRALLLLGQSVLGRSTGPDIIGLKRKDGRRVQVELRSVPVTVQGRTLVLGIARDVEERRQAEMALRESEMRLRHVLAVTGEGIWDWDLSQDAVRHNLRWCQILGLGEAELEHTVHEFLARVHEEDRPAVEERMRRCLEGAGPYVSEHRMRGAGDRLVWVLDRGDVVERGPDGAALRMVGSISDVTRRRHDEDAATAARLRLELALERSNISIWESDLRTGQVYLSPEWAAMLGEAPPHETTTTIDQLLGLVPPEDRQAVLEASRAAVTGATSRYSVEHRVRSIQGDWRWILSHGRVVERDGNGRALRLAGTNTDITERKRAEEAVARAGEEARHRADHLAALNEVGRAISTLGDLRAGLEAIYQAVSRVLPMDVFFVGLHDPEAGTISYPLLYDGGQRWDQGAPEPLTEGSSSARTIRSGQPFLLNRTPEALAAEVVPSHAIGDRARTSASLLFAPLPVGEGIIGVVSAQSYTPNAYDEDDLQLLVGIAYQAAIAIENARLYSASQQELADRRRTAEALRAGHAQLQERTAELQRSYSLLQAAFDATADGLLVVDREGKVSGANQRFFQMWKIPGHLARSADELTLVGMVLDQLRDAEAFRRTLEALHASPERESLDLLEFRDGRTFQRFSCPQVLDGQIVGRVWSFRDITERTMAERAAEHSERRFHDLFEFSPDAIVMADRSGRIALANRQAEHLFGWPRAEMIGQPVEHLIPESGRAAHRALRAGFTADPIPRAMGAGRANLRALRRDGTEVPVDVSLNPIQSDEGLLVAATIRDISDRLDGERRLLRAQRLESLGRLAGGIAHDLNNTLAPILMSLDMLRLEFPEPAKDLLDVLETGARRGADMVRQLLTFAKGSDGDRVPVEPHHLLRDIEKIVRSTFPKTIRFEAKYARELPAVLGDATQIHQVLLNLCVNARDAMPSGGTLTLTAEPFEVDSAFSGFVSEARPGRYLAVRVRDTGIGIAAENLDRILEPFFTTKGPEQGSGLGLATVVGILKGHGGFLRVYSEVGRGSTFEVYLPTASAQGRESVPVAETDFLGAGETVLVVDDEPAVRQMLRRMLERLQFTVITAEDGADALGRFQEHRNEIRLIMTDLSMPYMDGVLLVRTLRLMAPDARIIAMTGLHDEGRLQHLRGLGVTQILAKPFTRSALVAAVHQAIGSGPA